jgi:hypothetical protein
MGTGRSLSSGRPKAGPVGRCDGVAARSPGKLGQRDAWRAAALATPIARYDTSDEQVCSGRVAVGLHRWNALAPGAGTDAPFRVFAPTESER